MNPVYRRSTTFYLWSALTYLAIMGRYMITRDWPVFEIIPIFMPVWLVSALTASEDDERYAFLRMLPVPDRDVARAKLVLILGSAAFQWILMTGAALGRMDEGIADPSTLVYLTLVCGFGLVAAAGFQIAIWRYGISRMKPILIASIIAGIAFAIIHLASLKTVDAWPALSRLAVVEWLGGAPWISNLVLAALALLVFRALLRVGVRLKAASEEHL
jgi:ABC-2 family transporter protein